MKNLPLKIEAVWHGCDACSPPRPVTTTPMPGGEDMHGLIFVTWEKYLSERFGSSLLNAYRKAIGEMTATAPLVSRVYDDATLLAGVGMACQLTHLPADTLLREYGRYFILNGLTRHLCAYLLSQMHSGRDLLLTMRQAHEQMSRTPDGACCLRLCDIYNMLA